ncbi:FAD-dependent monooxygenase [Sphingopyxis sp.]|uniref:FAD-dependent oxidoreductase n=1 Tax=Sphingopyxis sp. TaxID=1908224 RepID=UPI002D779543|nr:FAD-dependent monooxygenase [Sphingopyxis sp.]HET6526358.1 FAD-dependent monooxygenase [Sphingopyxis sp.]
MFDTDVLIIGSGPAGLTSAALLSTYGIKNMVITKYGWLSDTPRAHITNQRAMEVLRDLDIEAHAKLYATGQGEMANNVFCYSLAGEEFGRMYSWGNHPSRKADYDLASPCQICDLPQNLLEPVLLEAAASRGSKVRFNAEYISSEQDEDGVTATVRDRLTGEIFTVRARYMIGADGGRSTVANDIGLEMKGEMGLSGSVNIIFDADLTDYVGYRPSVLYWILQPGAEIGGVGAGVIRMVRPWNEWMAIWGYDMAEGQPKLTESDAERIVRNLVGDEKVPIKIKSISFWTVNNMYAADYARGRIFCMGDAVHRHPPLNGLGSNTSIQDAYNLAWKLAMVINGRAGIGLLESYSIERQPVGKQIVERANASALDYPPIFEALGLLAGGDSDAVNAAIAGRKAATEEAKERRKALRSAIWKKNYEFNTHGVELNQRYRSTAALPDGAQPGFERGDAELYYESTTWPGAHLPHAWVERDRKRVSTLDLCGKGRFTLLTGIGGEAWRDAAANVEIELGVPVDVHLIGPAGSDAVDIYGDWAGLSEVEDEGAVLVRPDLFVAWRSRSTDGDETNRLAAAFKQILSLS